MIVVTTCDTAAQDEDGMVVLKNTAGEVIGDGWTDDDGTEWIAVDFGNVCCDINVAHLQVVPHPGNVLDVNPA